MVRQAHHQMVRTRIAPSPTGFAHVGTAYISIFNFAFAKKNKGEFIVRLEDTDVKREVRGAEEAIYEGLKWLGLSWDEGPDIGGKYGPYRQSERLEIYQKKAKELVNKGLAYEDKGAIRFKNPNHEVSWDDLVRGRVVFPADQVTDFVILKSDGFPTYNFGVVLDDILMNISHVIRGEEHTSNTPRQLVLYQALGANLPVFAHLPTLRNMETKKKLSKRRDPVDLRIFRDQGYLPEALVNFLCLQGWSHPEGKEIFDLKEFVAKFDMKRIRQAGPSFDISKLDWINGEYIRRTQNSKLKTQIYEFFHGKYPEDKIGQILPLVQTRIKTLKEFETLAGFFFKSPKVDKSYFGKGYKKHLRGALTELENADWEREKIDKVLLGLIDRSGFNTGNFFMDLRVAICGSRFTPPINDSVVILGKKESLSRIRYALK